MIEILIALWFGSLLGRATCPSAEKEIELRPVKYQDEVSVVIVGAAFIIIAAMFLLMMSIGVI